ncbi:MAG: peptide deformylase [Candidatus Niyogibacteria bacterium]|nr:peptide deformylase [Candidatus Niyogibacteria bacterium]
MPQKIVQKEDPVLRRRAAEIPPDQIRSRKIKDTIHKMSAALATSHNGIGLAAPQIGAPLAIFIVSEEARAVQKKADIINDEKERRKKIWKHFVFINPRLIKSSRKKELMPEGCLSVDGIFGKVKRAKQVTVEALDENGQTFCVGASGLFAQVLQHEMDHLDGILFIDKAEGLEKLSNE